MLHSSDSSDSSHCNGLMAIKQKNWFWSLLITLNTINSGTSLCLTGIRNLLWLWPRNCPLSSMVLHPVAALSSCWVARIVCLPIGYVFVLPQYGYSLPPFLNPSHSNMYFLTWLLIFVFCYILVKYKSHDKSFITSFSVFVLIVCL